MKTLAILLISFLFSTCVKSQSQSSKPKLIGGSCEGCEAIYEYGAKKLKSVDTLPDFELMENKIKIFGTVYQKDGKTPAKDVLLYFYHTNDKGIYPSKPDSKGWEKRHGYIRGWVKTDSKGKYAIYTSRPASYPNSSMPQHIHVTVKEPDKNEYYIDDVFFADDPNLIPQVKNNKIPRAGSGIITLTGNGTKQGKRDIVLGLNIPNYN